MKTNDLMIGNWVNFKLKNTNYVVTAQIYAIHADPKYSVFLSVAYNHKGNQCFVDVNPYDAKPVKLTAEILDKNGFNVQKVANTKFPQGSDLWIYADSECSVYIYENGVIWWLEAELESYAGKIEMSISDVHELQNAMHVFGINKKIEL